MRSSDSLIFDTGSERDKTLTKDITKENIGARYKFGKEDVSNVNDSVDI